MEREKMIEEMEKDLSKALDGNIDLVTRQYFTLEAEKKNGGMGVNVNIVGIAEILTNAGYRKVPDGAVVLTKEEYERLKALPEKVHDEMDERMREEIAIEKRMGERKVDQARKETAREIFDRLMKAERGDGFVTYTWSKSIIKQLANKYGVEVEE